MKMYKTYFTSAFCPKCGKLLSTSDISGYSFVCSPCNENFYTMEVTKNNGDLYKISIPTSMKIFNDNKKKIDSIVKIYNCCFMQYSTYGFVSFGWSKNFPDSNIFDKFLQDISALNLDS